MAVQEVVTLDGRLRARSSLCRRTGVKWQRLL